MVAQGELTDRVRVLRAGGSSPKDIARATGARPAEIATIVRTIARDAAAAETEPAVVGCWISHGWSTGLAVDGHPGWPMDVRDDGAEGLVCVAVARRHRPQRVSVCGYLVDVYCLGVKNTIGPEIMNERALPGFLTTFFEGIQQGEPPLTAPLDLAQHLVFGAVDHARDLGFEPHPDFAAAAGHLGTWQGSSAITFGRDGKPFYISGPHDNPSSVMRTLQRTAGDGNFDFVTHVG